MYKLYDYQQELVDKSRMELAKGKKSVLLVSPAGSGKSVVIAEIARLTTLKGGHVMFMVHRKELVNQIEESFKANNVNLELCTIMTVGKIKNRLNKLPKPSLIITDETHHARAKTYQTIYDYYKGVPKLGFTATPWRLNGDGFDDIYDVMIESRTVQWLIEHQRLSPYRMFAPSVVIDAHKLKKSGGDYTKKSIDDALKGTIFSDIIDSWERFAQKKQTIVYCHSIEFSKEVANRFNQAGISAVHADSKTPQCERDEIMNEFKKGKTKILCNVDLVSEGFNVPACGCVMMLRPTASLVLYIQQSMRCMRYKPNKQAIIIDCVANVERFGRPSDDRKWSIRARSKGKNKQEHETLVKSCPNCYVVVPAKCRKCPYCKYEFVQEETNGIEERKDIELVEVTDKNFNISVNYLITKKPSELESVHELKEYAKLKGYKSGWVYYQQKQRGWL